MYIEKRDVFFGGGGCAGSVFGVESLVLLGPGSAAAGVGFAGAEGIGFFFFGFLETDKGLNIMGLPTNLTSSAGFCSSGIDGPSCFLGNDTLAPASPPSSLPKISSPPSRLNAAAELVFRFTPGLGLALPDAAGLGLLAFLGGGRKELNPEKRPPLASPVRARLAGGSSAVEVAVCGRLTRILPGLERSTTFWKGFLEVEVEGLGADAT